MAASDQLAKLSARAKQAEDRVAAAREKAAADLEREVADARASSQAQAEKLRDTVDAGESKLSAWWADVERSWDAHITAIRKHVRDRKAQHDAADAELTAENAEDDASFAIEYAYAAIEEAEYAALDATLARMEADELAAAPGSRS
jgi:hypothetical protein